MAFINLSQLTKAVKGLVNKINSENYILSSKLGDLSDLDTTDKSNLVAAVNETMGKADTALPSTGDAYRALSIPMGHLDSTSTATVMTAQIDGITELRDGVCMWLYNGVVGSAGGVTLNINGLGAKPCHSSTSGYGVTNEFGRYYTFLMVYNSTRITGGCWDVVCGYDLPYSLAKLGFVYGVCTTAAETVAKRVSVGAFIRTTNGIVVIKFDNDVPAGATLTISSSGVDTPTAGIYYRGAAITDGVIKAGDTVTMMFRNYYHIISIDRDEAGVTMTDAEVDAAVEAAFAYTITNQAPTLVSVQSSASAGETVAVTNISNIVLEVRIGTTSGGYDVLRSMHFSAGAQNNFTMPDAQVFVSASAGGGSND